MLSRKIGWFTFVLALAIPWPLAKGDFAPADFSNHSGNDLATPTLRILEQPSGTYGIEDVIRYSIQVVWPALTQQIRMKPPELDLTNLQLLGIKQETISSASNQRGHTSND